MRHFDHQRICINRSDRAASGTAGKTESQGILHLSPSSLLSVGVMCSLPTCLSTSCDSETRALQSTVLCQLGPSRGQKEGRLEEGKRICSYLSASGFWFLLIWASTTIVQQSRFLPLTEVWSSNTQNQPPDITSEILEPVLSCSLQGLCSSWPVSIWDVCAPAGQVPVWIQKH